MDLISFIRLLLRNRYGIILFSTVMSFTVFMMLKDKPKKYEVSASLYTGVTGGTTIPGLEELSYNQTKSAYDNIIQMLKSRNTLVDVGIYLLAERIQSQMNSHPISKRYKPLPKDIVSFFKKDQNIDAIYAHLKKIIQTTGGQIFRKILNEKNAPYKAKTIAENIKVKRMGNSDIIKVSYTYTDPFICKSTVDFLLKVFTINFKKMKSEEVSSIAEFFKGEIAKTLDSLTIAENKLSYFRKKHHIINYKEETKFLSAQREKLEEFHLKNKLSYVSTKKQLEHIEEELALKKVIIKETSKIVDSKEVLTNLYSSIIKAEVLGESKEKVEQMKQEVNNRIEQVNNTLMKFYQMQSGKMGISSLQMIQVYFKQKLQLKEYESNIKGIDEIRTYYDKKYQIYGKLIGELERMKRNIYILEQRYYSLLQGLNTGQTQVASANMDTTFKIVDIPEYPKEPQKSKLLVISIVSWIAGFVLSVVIIVLIEFLDSSMKTIEVAEKSIGMSVVGAFVYRKNGSNKIDYNKLYNATVGVLIQNLRLNEFKSNSQKRISKYILLTSVKDNEGKSYILNILSNGLTDLREKVLVLTPYSYQKMAVKDDVRVIRYEYTKTLSNAHKISDFLDTNISEDEYNYIIIEYPSIIHHSVPIHFLSTVCHTLLVVNSNRSWDASDRFVLEELNKINNNSTKIVLNGMQIHNLEAFIGDIPRQRSIFRKTVKRLLSFQFNKRFNA